MIALEKYLVKWNGFEQKPSNEKEFIDLFIEYIKSIDDVQDVEFEGEGAYFGRQVSIFKDRNYMGNSIFHFEIAYDGNNITVYTGNHHGYWTPVYLEISEKHERWSDLSVPFFSLLRNVFCV